MVSDKMLKPVHFMIAAGIVLAVSCLAFAVINPASKSIDILNIIFLILQASFGIAIIVASKKISHKFFHMFMGYIFLFWSIISILTDIILPFTKKEMWPMYGVAAGVAMIIAGYRKYRSIKFGYLIPAVTLCGMGIWYLFFSMNIITLSFRIVVFTLGPVFLISVAALLVIFFLVQQKHKELVFSDDEIGVFSDEEASFKFDSDDDE